MFERILLALDDSPASEVALLFAGALARRTNASVHVVHVNERIVACNGVTLRTRDEATALVTDAVRHLAESGVTASGTVCLATYRKIADRIVAKADDVAADAIVLGSTRSRHWMRVFSSQIRERTTRLTALPVLTAPAPLKISPLPAPGSWDGSVDRAVDTLLR